MSRLAPRRGLVRLALTVALVVGSAACTGSRPHLAAEADTTSTQPGDSGKDATQSEVAQAKSAPIDIYDSDTGGTPTRQISADDVSSTDVPIVFLVTSHHGERVEVVLPTAPAGSTGWVNTSDVELSSVSFRIEISLGAHQLQVLDDGRSILDAPISVGGTDTPVAGTAYYLKELLQPPDQSGPYGRYAYVFSGSSATVDSFSAGAGIVGIHGTTEGSSIGGDTEKGSIGVAADVLDRLVDEIGLPLGTPVTVKP